MQMIKFSLILSVLVALCNHVTAFNTLHDLLLPNDVPTTLYLSIPRDRHMIVLHGQHFGRRRMNDRLHTWTSSMNA